MTKGAYLHLAEAEGRLIEKISHLAKYRSRMLKFFLNSYPSADLILFLPIHFW